MYQNGFMILGKLEKVWHLEGVSWGMFDGGGGELTMGRYFSLAMAIRLFATSKASISAFRFLLSDIVNDCRDCMGDARALMNVGAGVGMWVLSQSVVCRDSRRVVGEGRRIYFASARGEFVRATLRIVGRANAFVLW